MNPYEATSDVSTSLAQRRPVRRCFAAATLLFAFAALFGVPAAILIYQNIQFVPTDTHTTRINIGGHELGDEKAIALLLAITMTLAIPAFAWANSGIQNHRWNSRSTTNAPRHRSWWRAAVGICLLVAASVVSGPAVASLSMSVQPPGARYATYDLELFLFGFPVSIATARWIGFTVGPVLLILGIYLLATLLRKPLSMQSSDDGEQDSNGLE